MVSIDDPSQYSIQINSITVTASPTGEGQTQIDVDWALEVWRFSLFFLVGFASPINLHAGRHSGNSFTKTHRRGV
jgi:hypothetical protein